MRLIMINYSNVSCLYFSLLLIIFSETLYAAPNGKDLLVACEYSLSNGFTDPTGMMCTWYVTPCNCSYGKTGEIPRVCLSTAPDVNALARQVTEGLRRYPELLDKNADVAAATILEKYYPCAEKE